MAPETRILGLESAPDDAAEVAAWIMSEWGRLPIHNYFDGVSRRISPSETLPRTWVAYSNGRLVGTISLLLNDLETRPDLNPWVGCLYVHSSWRRRGVGSSLLRLAEKEANQQLGIRELFLFTENQVAMYSKLGWTVFASEAHNGRNVTIMKKDLRQIDKS